jgi:bifunctional non-homologous end joining protein LigD
MVMANREGLTTHMAKAGREAQILIDTLRNARGATWVAPWSPRARPGLTVSTPIAWEELTPALRPDRFTLDEVATRVASGDPWQGIAALRQSLTRAMFESIAAPPERVRSSSPAFRSNIPPSRGRKTRRKPR